MEGVLRVSDFATQFIFVHVGKTDVLWNLCIHSTSTLSKNCIPRPPADGFGSLCLTSMKEIREECYEDRKDKDGYRPNIVWCSIVA